MASYTGWGPIEEVNGAIGKKKDCVCRTKHYKIDEQGHTIAGKKEIYKVTNKRDYKKHPQVGAEKESSMAFSRARQLRIKVQTEMPELLERWKAAFVHQLTVADADSPLLPGGKRKKYIKLANYMETKIRQRGMNIESFGFC
ncbi:MAG: hypothetical protein MJZ55_01365 [Paludibacteraceae bacterium]|nr:hypothetical protein [Paludibacteraceae bacterium]